MKSHSQSHKIEHGDGVFFSREAIRGIPWMVMGKGLLFFIYFGVTMLVVNGLGREKFGVYSLMVNISSYLVVVCGLGMGAALMRYVPELVVHKNRRGLVHLLWKSATFQLLAVLGVTALLLSFSSSLQRLFHAELVAHFDLYLKLACGLTGLLLLKDFVGTVFTAVFKIRIVAILLVVQAVVWLVALFYGLDARPEVDTVFWAQMVAVGTTYLVGGILLVRHVHALPWPWTYAFGIGKRRTLKFSGIAMLGSILRMVMFKYSEVFFIAAVGGMTLAGVYDLGYTLPYTVVTFIPLALLPLFTSAFAEAYVKDRGCLGRMISSYYKLLMMLSLPAALLGAYFSPVAYHIIYKGAMDEAGRIAGVFCVILILPLISMPLSAAIKAKEKMLNMVPMLLFQIVVNLFLDWLLIVQLHLGVTGGILAVAGTFMITIPFRLWVVRGILGGLFFPWRFGLRIGVVLWAESAALHWGVGRVGLFDRFAGQGINIVLLFAVALLYLGLFLLLVRFLRLLRPADVAGVQRLEISSINRLLRWLVVFVGG